MLSSHNWDIVQYNHTVLHRKQQQVSCAAARGRCCYLCLQVIEFMAFIFCSLRMQYMYVYVLFTKKKDFLAQLSFSLIFAKVSSYLCVLGSSLERVQLVHLNLVNFQHFLERFSIETRQFAIFHPEFFQPYCIVEKQYRKVKIVHFT